MDALPGLPFDNSYARLPERFYARLSPTPVAAPRRLGGALADVPTWREPAAFTMLSRDVRPIIGNPGTLQAQATFRNEARWAQAWPRRLHWRPADSQGRYMSMCRSAPPARHSPQR